jgi:tetratricopeptide (TPR) repeat protein
VVRVLLPAYLLTLVLTASLRVGVWADSVSLWTATATINGDDPIVQSNLADALESAKRGDEAEAHFWRAIEIWDAHPAAHLGLGTFLLRRNRIAESATHLERAVELAPQQAGAWGNLGICRRELGDAAGAVRAFQEAVARGDGSLEFHTDLGLAQAAAGDLAGAASTFKALSAGTGENAGLLEAAQLWSKKLEHARALPYYQAAVMLAPQDPEGLDGLGACLLELGRHAEARTHLNAALALAPGHVGAREHLGICCAAQGRFAEAEAVFAALVEEQPQRAHGHLLLAMAQRERQQFAAAANSMARAGRLAKQPAWLVQAGEFHVLGGATAAARALAQEALLMSPGFVPAQGLLAKLGR